MILDQILDMAARCQRLAECCHDRELEAHLRGLAAEYLARASSLRSRPPSEPQPRAGHKAATDQ